MTKAREIDELGKRIGREVAIEYLKNLQRVVSEEQAEIEDYAEPRFAGEFIRDSIIL